MYTDTFFLYALYQKDADEHDASHLSFSLLSINLVLFLGFLRSSEVIVVPLYRLTSKATEQSLLYYLTHIWDRGERMGYFI